MLVILTKMNGRNEYVNAIHANTHGESQAATGAAASNLDLYNRRIGRPVAFALRWLDMRAGARRRKEA